MSNDDAQDYLKHPKILKNQVSREMITTFVSIPFMTLLTTPVFLGEVRGYSKLTSDFEFSTAGVLNEVRLQKLLDCDARAHPPRLTCVHWIGPLPEVCVCSKLISVRAVGPCQSL